jgi:ectoine hydroxylase-related dioxygenase (phytanoyl-CoA dioxygenase family)
LTNLDIDEAKRAFFENGYLKVDTDIGEDTIHRIVNTLKPHWISKTAPVGVLNHHLQEANLKLGSNRLQDLWEVIKEVKLIALNENILCLLEALFDRSPKPFQTLNFPVGTEQGVHSDAVHFNSDPFGLMCGVWVALEDIHQDQGPLVYFPESHNLPMVTEKVIGFEPTSENYPRLVSYWEEKIKEKPYQRELGILNKGQAIIWHANLLHGGAPQTNKAKSRNSQVTHYYFEGAKPWRQLQSSESKEYFEPNWIS